tara:strand:- start:1064 stop:1330 length:267 start_codon:yes stop_codon:yes gene_type:complete
MIIAKKETMGESCPSYDGDSFLEAKKKMIHADPEPDMDHMEEMRHIAGKLHECADRLQEMSGESMDETEESKDSKESKDDSYGDPVEA